MFLKCPVFKPHLKVELIKGEGVFLLTEQKHVILRGRLYETIVPQINGQAIPGICSELQNQVSPAEVFYTVEQLQNAGYLEELDDHVASPEGALWTGLGINTAFATTQLAKTVLSVQIFGEVDEKPIRTILSNAGLTLGDQGDCAVILTDSYLRKDISRWDLEARRNKIPWVLAKPVGQTLWLGPLFHPDKRSCWACLCARFLANHPVIAYLEEKLDGRGQIIRARSSSGASIQMAGALIANAATSLIVRGEIPYLESKIQTFDVATGKTESHDLVSRPWCKECGRVDLQSDFTPPNFQDQKVERACREGGYRSVPPEETMARYAHHVSPLIGIVPELKRIAFKGDNPLPVYVAGPNVARNTSSLAEVRNGFRSMASGKGKTDAQARTGALAEALERYSAEFRGNEIRRSAAFDQLGQAAIHPNSCMLFSEKQYESRHSWNAKASDFNIVPAPFDSKAEIDWSPLWSMTRKEIRYLPTAFCYFHVPHGAGSHFCSTCSNGNAAGNTLEEAVLQGLLEVVERDSVALWWYNRVRRSAVDLASFEEPSLEKMRDFLAKKERDLWVLDLTTDLNIPVFVALSKKVSHREQQIILGFGAHLDPTIALMRATTELSQMLRLVLSSEETPPMRTEAKSRLDREVEKWLSEANISSEPYLAPREGSVRKKSDFVPISTSNLCEDIFACQKLMERQGMEILVLDQTRSDVGLHAVKVVVPGMRHFWARFAPGRLYDVPKQMGWVPERLKEEELNPIPLFL